MNYKKPVWITWERQRRSMVLSKEFGCDLIICESSSSVSCVRYIYASMITISYIINAKPNVVFCQNPSMILAVLLCTIKKVMQYKLIVDRHSNFLFNMPETIKYKIFNRLSEYTIKTADLTIVTNKYIKEQYIENVGGNGTILQDKIPDMHTDNKIKTDHLKNVFFITSFSRDEPIKEFFEAIDGLSNDYYFYVSGDFNRLKIQIPESGINYELTGFVDESKFKAILNSVQVVMVFTKHEYTLTCGAYEGVAANKPLILSNTKTIRDYFDSGAVYCDMTPKSIRSGIIECFNKLDKLNNEISVLKDKLMNSWTEQFNNVRNSIYLK